MPTADLCLREGSTGSGSTGSGFTGSGSGNGTFCTGSGNIISSFLQEVDADPQEVDLQEVDSQEVDTGSGSTGSGFTGSGSTGSDLQEVELEVNPQEVELCVTVRITVKCNLENIIYPNYHYLDLNACVTLANCDVNADCADTNGSFTCTCREGYTGNGIFCSGKMLG